jgi:signal transduction histidine kinase
MPLYTWVVADDRRGLRDHLRRCRDATEPVSTELELDLRRESGEVPVELVSAMQRGADGQVTYRTVMVNLTERRRAETDRQRLHFEKQRAEMANEAKARFLGVLSHELRTPLTPILAAAGELEASEALPPELRKVVAMIRRNAELEARLIDDLLDVTRIDRDKLEIRREPVDVHQVLRSVLEICAAEILQAGLELDVRLESPRAIVTGDATRLHQVFWNLLINAARHTPRGGGIGVHTERDDRTLRVRISDTGEGMERTTLERVFLPFEQAVRGQRGGLGLGLTISRGLVAAHGGELSADSAGPGRGATFDVTLPLLQRPLRQTNPVPIRPSRPLVSGTVLLVEDHTDSAEMLCRMLTRAGYTVRVAHSMLEARQTMASDVDVVVSDIGLPDGSGLDLVGQLKKVRPIVAVALSGFGGDNDRRASREAGFAAHLTKPVTYGDLVDAVEQARAAG